MQNLMFADATSTPEEARFVIFGVPYDRTTSFRPGARFGPAAIRGASSNFEQYDIAHDFDIGSVAIADAGDLAELGPPEEMVKEVRNFAAELTGRGKFPILLGGEHSVAPPAVEAHRGLDGVISIDAHLDFRPAYHGSIHSHACSTRRIADIVGVDRIIPVGIRSMSSEERRDAQELGLRYVRSFEILDQGVGPTLEMLQELSWERIYMTLDIDGIDPAYAPGTGTPEPFGLTPYHVKRMIDELGPRLVGFDINEVSPPWDQGQTAALAARLVREVIVVASGGG